MNNPLLDTDFLKELDRIRLKEIYAEIFALNSNEEIIESIEGYITQGNINIDGDSSVRRTCNLTLVANELNIHEYYWGLHTKFKLRIGIKNEINSKYPDIIWFKQGIFIISSFTTSQNLSNYIINIQGKDKMAKLNGDLGGMIIGLSHDFGKELIELPNEETREEPLSLKNIIIGAVHQFANEPLYNIIVNDLEDQGVELLEYRGKEPMYIEIDEITQEPTNLILNQFQQYYIGNNSIPVNQIPKYNPLFDLERKDIVNKYTIVNAIPNDGKPLSIAKLEYGQTAGYRLTELIYAGDLILNVGQPVTAMLDKIVEMLGPYEYFYDIDGRFVFQKKKTYLTTSWNNIINNQNTEYGFDYKPIKLNSEKEFNEKKYYYINENTGMYEEALKFSEDIKYYELVYEQILVEPSAYTSAISYSFEDGILISSYQNNPNFANIKNDFSVWGTKKSLTGIELPVHMRFAIDTKPVLFVDYDGIHYSSLSQDKAIDFIKELGKDTPVIIKNNLDWRELIYQMALDFNKNHLKEDFYVKIENNNYGIYKNGKTGYEQYYTDLIGFWRELYNPEYISSFQEVSISKEAYSNEPNKYYYKKDNYIQCNENIPYNSTVQYYVYTEDSEGNLKLIQANGVSRAIYMNNPTKYYCISSSEPTKINTCVITEPYKTSGNGYYDSSGLLLGNVSKTEYEANPQNYYYIKSNKFLACASIEKYQNNKKYYYKVQSIYLEKKDLSEEEYYSSPGLYYFKEYVYRQCSINENFNASITYYHSTVNTTSNSIVYAPVKNLEEKTFKENPMLYYVRSDSEPTYIRCVTPIREYIKGDYYKLINGDYIKLEKFDLSIFNEEIYSGFLYYKSIVFEKCVHPIEYSSSIKYYEKLTDEYDAETGWAKNIFLQPETLNFWFDFLDESSELHKYGCHVIGNRPKGINDKQVKAIYFRETPSVVFINSEDWESVDKTKIGYTYLNLPKHMEALFSISAQGKSAKSVIDDFLYAHAGAIETITISTLPIFYLIPNTRIFVHNKESGINGEYILTKYNINLGINNNMTINATKAVDKLY